MKILWVFLIVTLAKNCRAHPTAPPKSPCGYQSCHPLKEGFTNIHIVSHTHDDVGWLKTVDQYYYGNDLGHEYIQEAGVEGIINTVIESLKRNPDRKFIYVETAYLWKWWRRAHDALKHQFKGFINKGQLEIIGGGWSMNDEAAAHYQSIIDQFTWGMRKLNDTFGSCARPKIGWQIDPFGHSREMASIFAELGFDAAFLGRIDYQDKKRRFVAKDAEMIWQGSYSLGKSSQIFTSVMYNTYSPPTGFCWDVYCADEPIIDDKKSDTYNVDKRVNEFLSWIDNMTKVYGPDNVLVTMGNDFNYQYAEKWFQNIDKLIYYVNKRQENGSKYNIIYSTPSCYAKAVHDIALKTNKTYSVKTDDFFPYASDPHAYWTGYFTSRPTQKRFERIGNNFLQVCKQLYALTDLGPEDWADLNVMREAMGVLQHHDAITGTEKQHVADDYAKLLSKGIDECHFAASTALGKIVTQKFETIQNGEDPKPAIPFESCLLSNISQCNLTENLDTFVVTIYNPLSRRVNHYVRLPVPSNKYSVTGPDGKELYVDVFPIHDPIKNIPGRNSTAEYEILFLATDLPPLGFKSYYVKKGTGQQKSDSTVYESNAIVDVDNTTGLITAVVINGVKFSLQQDFLYYVGAIGNNYKERASGAYIFRPAGKEALKTSDKVEFHVIEGGLAAEVRQVFNEWVSQIVRVYINESYVEFDWLIGPIPSTEKGGKEVITRFTTTLQSNSTFYTDSNGREMLKRVRDYRPTWKLNLTEPISSNYYPVPSKILIRDPTQDLEVAVLTDRAQGGTSLTDGEIELMVHRRCVNDDGFGVDEPLMEEAFGKGLVARGSHYLVGGPYLKQGKGKSIAAIERDIAQRKLLSAWTFISPTTETFKEYKAGKLMEYSGLKRSLPDNVQILTLEPWVAMSLLLRLEHVLEKGEDPVLSKPVTVNLQNLFAPFEIIWCRETTLGANQWLDEKKRMKFPSKDIEDPDYLSWLDSVQDNNEFSNNIMKDPSENSGNETSEFKFTLDPMQIRTFIIEFKKRN